MLQSSTFQQAVDDCIDFLEDQARIEMLKEEVYKRDVWIEYLSCSFVSMLSLVFVSGTAFMIYRLIV